METRYVNTASTAGGDGTTNNTAGATRAFATLREALDSLPGTLTDAYTIYCSGSAADTSDVDQAPWDFVTSPTNYLLVTTQGAQRHSGVWNSGIYRLEKTDDSVLHTSGVCHVRLDCLQIKVTLTTGSAVGVQLGHPNKTLSNIDCRATNCIVWGVVSGGNLGGFAEQPFDAGASGTTVYINCIAIDCTNGFPTQRAGCRMYNCGAYGSASFGFVDDDGGAIARNCLASSSGVGGFVGTFGGTGTSNNAEDDGGGAPGTSSFSGTTFTFVNAAADNFHLAAGDAGAQGRGVDLSADATYPFSTDIHGETRTGSWDIGPDQVTDIPPISNQAETLHVIRSGIRLN